MAARQMNNKMYAIVRVKVKLPHYRPLGLQEIGASRISTQSAHEDGKVVSTKHRPPLTTGGIPGTHFC